MWTEQRLFSALLAALLVVSMAAKEELKEATQRPPVAVSTNSITNSTNNSTTNSTSTHSGVLLSGLNVDSMMIQRALYVLIGSTLLGVLYMLVRAVRSMKRPQQKKKKKYGLLENYDDGVELDPMDSDEDDTLYEARALRR